MPLFSEMMADLMWTGFLETLQMTVVSTVIAIIVGVPLGVVLVVTSKNQILENYSVNHILGVTVNILRSIPFII